MEVRRLDAATVANQVAGAFGAEATPDDTNGVPGFRMERAGVTVVVQPFFGGWSMLVRRPNMAEKSFFSETAGDLVRELGRLGLRRQ